MAFFKVTSTYLPRLFNSGILAKVPVDNFYQLITLRNSSSNNKPKTVIPRDVSKNIKEPNSKFYS